MKTDRNRTLLLIEDNPDLRIATLDLLQTLGYQVTVVDDATQASKRLQVSAFDLALVNAYPTRGTGLDAVDALRAQAPQLPVLLTSGFGDDLELRRRVVTGDVEFLSIPFSRQQLGEKIEEAVGRKPGGAPGELAAAHAVGGPRPGGAKPRRTRALLAAALAMVAAGVIFQVTDRSPRMPAPEATETRRGTTVELLEPIGALSAKPARLAWRETPESSRYRVALSTVDDTTLWQTETQETSIDLPEEIAEQLHAAVSYFWQVESLGQDSSVTGRSTLVAFRFGASRQN